MDTLNPITKWNKVCLDTSVILGLLKSMRSDCNDTICLFIKQLVKQLVNADTQFIVSAISESEILQRYQLKSEKQLNVLKAIGSNDTTFVAFDSDIAYHLTNEYYSLLNKESVKGVAKDVGWDTSNYDIVREHVTRDLMIIASSDYFKCDVILTCDKKTMYKQAFALNIPCAITQPKYFNATNAGIFEYYQQQLDKDLRLIQ